jgi:hypothetical protein
MTSRRAVAVKSCPPALDADSAGQCPGFNAQITPTDGGLEKYTRRTPAPPAHYGHFAALKAFALLAVIVIGRRKTRGDARRANLLVQHVRFGNRNFQFSLGAMV